MQSQIDPTLPEETSGPKIGKVLIARLRAQLAIARDESSSHGTGIEELQSITEALQGVDEALAESINELASSTADTLSSFIDQVNVWSKCQRSRIVALTAVSNVYTPDFSAGNFFSFTLGANCTLANPTNLPDAGITQSGSLFITQDATGGRTITFGNKFQAAGGISTIMLSTGANVRDRIDYVVSPNGNIQVSIAKDVKA